jgi:SAM-dependent methyltransferase
MSAPGEARFEREYYEAVYPDYSRQNPPRKLGFYRRLVERVAPLDHPARILDIGCAFGDFLSMLDPGWERFGADVSRFAIEKAAASVPDATFARAGFSDLPFSGPFDIITAFDVIEHVPSLAVVADAVASRLPPGGHFIFVVPLYDGPTGPVIRLLDRDPTHVHKKSRDFWLAWAQERFEVREWWGVYRYLIPGLGYLHLPTKRLRRYTPAIVVIARKPA